MEDRADAAWLNLSFLNGYLDRFYSSYIALYYKPNGSMRFHKFTLKFNRDRAVECLKKSGLTDAEAQRFMKSWIRQRKPK